MLNYRTSTQCGTAARSLRPTRPVGRVWLGQLADVLFDLENLLRQGDTEALQEVMREGLIGLAAANILDHRDTYLEPGEAVLAWLSGYKAGLADA